MKDETPDAGDDASPPGEVLKSLDTWKRYLIAVAAILTVAAQLWGIIENQWKLAGITLILVVMIAALYFISHRIPIENPRLAAAVRVTIICLLIAVPVCSLSGLAAYSYLPRLTEGDLTTIAVAEFSGPTLPDPYKECRPSDMLAHTLTKVGGRFGGVRAFELPYSIDPDNRWATTWAEFHGTIEAADILVYGEYILYESGAAGQKGDEVVINPEVTRIPSIPLNFTSAPLYGWSFTGSVAKVRELCGSDLRDAGYAPRFLDDTRRIASAIAGLRALGRLNFKTAEEADTEAKRSEIERPQQCSVIPEKAKEASQIEQASLCPAVLAFYLATLDARLGNLADAIHEYAYAAPKLGTSAAFINLGELYMQVGQPEAGFKAFDDAVRVDPLSAAAWATRSQYERDYLMSQQAWLDLNRAIDVRKHSHQGIYDDLVLSRAIYQLGGKENRECGIRTLRTVLFPDWPVDMRANASAGVDALVRYGVWLNGEHEYSEAITELREALEENPDSVQGNYVIGLAYEKSKPPNPIEAESFLRRAEYAPAYTDEDYLYQANAADNLVVSFDKTAEDRGTDFQQAVRAYHQSIGKNSGAAYAYYGLSVLERREKNPQGFRDLESAARLHPNDALIQSDLGDALDSMGQKARGSAYHKRASYVASHRLAKMEAQVWDARTCSYAKLDR